LRANEPLPSVVVRLDPGHVLLPGHPVSLYYRGPTVIRARNYSIMYSGPCHIHRRNGSTAKSAPSFSISQCERGCREKQMLGLKRRLETSHVIAIFDLPAFERPIDKCILSRQSVSISYPSTSHHLHQASLSSQTTPLIYTKHPQLTKLPSSHITHSVLLQYEALHRLRRPHGGLGQRRSDQLLE
jgi:hypothetical protein